MIKQSKAQILLADNRLQTDTPGIRSWHTLSTNEGSTSKSVGELYLFNEHWLAPAHQMVLKVNAGETLLLLPVSGAIEYTDLFNNSTLLAAGQCLQINAAQPNSICIKNPFADTVVSFIQLRLSATTAPSFNVQAYNDVNAYINTLVTVAPPQGDNQFFIAKFNGRAETVYTQTKESTGIFLFVLVGAFEAEGRLLHAGDALALYETDCIEMEALSNDAIILLIETRLHNPD
ncbi:MAG: hypothetical protein RLZZ316_1843 [Bacteroidota bacterium]|jgi:hypothetical protein